MSASGDSGNDIRIRDVSADDLPVFFEHQRDPVAASMVPFEPRDQEAFADHWAKIMADPTTEIRTVVVAGRVAGNVQGFERDGLHEVGYWIGREFWGRGVATKALSQFLDQITIRPLHAVVAKDNVGSIRVLEKNGFVVVGERTGAPDGRGADVEEFLMVLEED